MSNADADAPRVAQWIDDDDDDELDIEPVDNKDNTLHDGLASLSMGTLRTAQALLESDDSNDSDSQLEEQEQEESRPSRPKNIVSKRPNKHAPTELSSKRPVSRKRLVVNPSKPQARDPRFLSLAGEFSKEKYRKNYSFLTDAHEAELGSLQDSLRRAKRLFSSTPKSSRHDKEQEVKRLELAVKRAESAVNQDRQEKVEREALTQAAQQEREKHKAGKARWWMKKSEKREMLTRARFEHIAKQGGSRAVKKAIAKKQKKIAAKEKRSRPFSEDDYSVRKRRKIE